MISRPDVASAPSFFPDTSIGEEIDGANCSGSGDGNLCLFFPTVVAVAVDGGEGMCMGPGIFSSVVPGFATSSGKGLDLTDGRTTGDDGGVMTCESSVSTVVGANPSGNIGDASRDGEIDSDVDVWILVEESLEAKPRAESNLDSSRRQEALGVGRRNCETTFGLTVTSNPQFEHE